MADQAPLSHDAGGDTLRGFFFALSAYLLWGVLPLYMKAVAHIPPVEVVAHRLLWSVPVAGILLVLLGRTSDIKRAISSPKTLAMAALTATIISINWLVYVLAIATDRAMEAALGYYINPLVSIAMGALLLRERLSPLQLIAVCIATAGVMVLAVEAGGLPWISLALAFSFAIYGFLRKTLPIGPSQGFFLEVLILSIPALSYVVWLQWRGESNFSLSQPLEFWLLIGCGPVSAIPLILYAYGAKFLRYATIGIMQYIAPTAIFLVALFVFQEPFGGERKIAFALIWLALAIYTWPMLRALAKKNSR